MTDSTGILPQLKFMGLTALRPSMYIRTAINLLLGFAGVAAFLQLLIGGVLWIVAGGEKVGSHIGCDFII